jgi:hypothetical protein
MRKKHGKSSFRVAEEENVSTHITKPTHTHTHTHTHIIIIIIIIINIKFGKSKKVKSQCVPIGV